MAETFIWKVRNRVSVRHKPKVRKISFGDGYEQRNPKGFNQNLPRYNVEIMPDPDEIETVLAFLNDHAGYKAFHWTPARQGASRLYVCESWNTTDETDQARIRATFREVVA